MFDEIEGKQTARAIAAIVVAVVFAVLAAVKVKNELRMTEMYERQAVALERIAAAAEVGSFGALKSAAIAQVALEHARGPVENWIGCAPGVMAKDEKGCSESRAKASAISFGVTTAECTPEKCPKLCYKNGFASAPEVCK